jgi:hypothetical protein
MTLDPKAGRPPTELEQFETVADAAAIDLSPLAGFDLSSVTVKRTKIHGFVTAHRGASPLEAIVGAQCEDRRCPYRCIELRLHPSMGELLANYEAASVRQGLAPGEFIGQFDRDVFVVSSAFPVMTADLSGHPILHKVRLSLDRLHEAAAGTPEWELVRTIRDGCHTSALELPVGAVYSGRDLLVHLDLANRLRFDRQGSMDDLTPIINTDAREELALAWRLRALFSHSQRD